MPEPLQLLAILLAVFYLTCCLYLGWKSKDWMEVGIAVVCILMGLATALWWPL